MEFTKNLRYLGCRIGEIGEKKDVYYTVTLFDESTSTTFDTGFMATSKTSKMEDRIVESTFGDILTCVLILRPAEKANRYKIGLRDIS